MSRIRLAGTATVVLAIAFGTLARAENISAKKLFIKENADPAKRQVLLESADPAVHFSDAVAPNSSGATLHLYSATDDFCATLAPGAGWVNKKNKLWKFKDKASKGSAQLKNGRLLVSIKSGVTFSLADNGTQGTLNAQVQFGTGTRFCMRCSGAKKDDAKKFLAKNCAAADCAPEPPGCGAAPTTTTTTSTPTSTIGGTTTTLAAGSITIKGALASTKGRFNYDLTIGLPGANTACNSNFAGTHACTYAELQNVAASGGLVGLKDVGNNTVTAFWAIDNASPILQQCNDDTPGTGSGLNWEYPTAHTMSRGEMVALDNATGGLGPLQMSIQCNFSTASVGCCL